MVEPGAIIFSPPTKANKDNSVCSVQKYHVCLDCWKPVIKAIDNLETIKVKNES